jgi:hypothetical protein
MDPIDSEAMTNNDISTTIILHQKERFWFGPLDLERLFIDCLLIVKLDLKEAFRNAKRCSKLYRI